ncbi:MAG: lipoyl(octanoyl) transferase LipB [Anaerolineales bacterium]
MNGTDKTVATLWLGRISYRRAWILQSRLAEAIAAGKQPPALLLLEHPHTYTLGRSGSWDNLLWDQQQIIKKGVEVHEADRGGDITYHGPGQLVAYPLLPLGQVDAEGHLPGPDFHGYLRKLELILIQALAKWGIEAAPIEGLTGVWVDSSGSVEDHSQLPAKIGAIGVKIDANGVSRHGFALNVDPDMSYWKGIVPCGILNYPVTSIANELAAVPSMDEVRAEILRQFAKVFDVSLVDFDSSKPLSADGVLEGPTA